MKRIAALVAVFYIIFWWVTWTALLGAHKAEFPGLWSKHFCRESRAFFMGLAAIPVVPWVMAPFFTGFYQDGFQASCSDAPDVDQYDALTGGSK